MPHVLCVGTDPSLLYTRSLVLGKSGALVTTATLQGGIPLLKQSTFDLLVLCHSIQDGDLRSLCREVRACCPSIRILLVEAPGVSYAAVAEVDDRFALEDGPQGLLAAVRSMLSVSTQDLLLSSVPRRTPALGMYSPEAAPLQRPLQSLATRYPAASGDS